MRSSTVRKCPPILSLVLLILLVVGQGHEVSAFTPRFSPRTTKLDTSSSSSTTGLAPSAPHKTLDTNAGRRAAWCSTNTRREAAPLIMGGTMAAAAASVLAGSIAGAIGVGIAHPLDTLNIKTQVLQASTSHQRLLQKRKDQQQQEQQRAEQKELDKNNIMTSTTLIQEQDVFELLEDIGNSIKSTMLEDKEQDDTVYVKINVPRSLASSSSSSSSSTLTSLNAGGTAATATTTATLVAPPPTITKGGARRRGRRRQSEQQPWATADLYQSRSITFPGLYRPPPLQDDEHVWRSSPSFHRNGGNSAVQYSIAGATSAIATSTLTPASPTTTTTPATTAPADSNDVIVDGRVDTWKLMQHVYETEGLAGFLGGIRIMILGQGLVKAVSFTVNAVVLYWLVQAQTLQLPALSLLYNTADDAGSPSTAMFLLAAISAGFVSSFVVNPVERVKVVLQAQEQGSSPDRTTSSSTTTMPEWDCIQRVVQSEGWLGFFGRGLGTTMLREVPSDAIYFSVYGILMQTYLHHPTYLMMGIMPSWVASMVFGATAGWTSWLPVYPVDLVKTLVQNTDGKTDGVTTTASHSTLNAATTMGEQQSTGESPARNTIQVVQDLYAAGGIGAFYDGIAPKLLRAAVFHAVTFLVYDSILPVLQSVLER